ncbi:MAG: MBOAT family protein [Myxococcota bacterium]
MPFPTLPFAAFFLVVLALTWLVRRSRAWRNALLLLASYIFYAGWSPRLALLLLGSSVVTWALGEAVARAQPGPRGWWTGIAVTLNVAFLGFFKYCGFFLENVDSLVTALGLGVHLPVLEVLLPVGISFFTFQNIAYVVDLHRGHGVKAKSLWDYLLFVSFFPQLLIGPICRSRDLLPQIEAAPPQQVPDLSRAVSLIASGVFKKVVLATFMQTHLVDNAFLAPENYGSFDLLVAAYAYTILLYFDFSGYTDMARGIGLLLGFHLPENFNQPYRSTSIAEFWRRWHMTFGNWLRDYIYFPLGGGKKKPLRVYVNLMITLLVAGFWHGAHWKYLIWGGIHGSGIVAYKVVQDRRKARGISARDLTFSWWYTALAWAWTFHLVVFARILFKTADLDVAGTYWWTMLSALWTGDWAGQGVEWLILVFIGLGLALNFWGQHVRRWFIEAHERVPAALRPVVWVGLGVLLLALQPDDVAPFVYFQF